MKHVLIGGGDLARELACWIQGDHGPDSIIGYYDDAGETLLSSSPYNLRYLGPIAQISANIKNSKIILAVSAPQDRRAVGISLETKGYCLSSFIHSSAVVAYSATISDGVLLLPKTIVSSDAVIAKGCCINVQCSIGHDVKVGEYCTLSSHVDLMGWVEVGDCVFMGSGSRIIPKVKIECESRIGAGSIVTRRVRTGMVAYGASAKIL